ncbi:MAG: hypothetical protein WCV86_00580 [Patescibacteria group bacterium]|jgi:tetratricopeptide (TPR) repeat protein
MAFRIRQRVFGAESPKFFPFGPGILGVLLFIIPLLFMPMMVDSWETTKSTVFVLGVLAVMLVTIIISSREQRLPRIAHKGDWFWLAFVVLYLLSFLLSVHPLTSLFGLRGAYTESLLVFGSLLLFFYLIRVYLRDARLLLVSFWILVAGMTFAALFYLMGLFGFPILGNVSELPLLANSLVMVSVASALALTALLYIILSGRTGAFVMFTLAGIVIHGLLLFVLDLNIAWYVLLLGLLLMVYLLGIRGGLQKSRRVGVLIGLAALAIVFLVLDLTTFTNTQLVQDILLGQSASAQIALDVTKAHPVLGSGPNTFLYDYLRFAPAELYQSGANIQFVRAGSQWWQWLATLGAGGLLLVGLMIATLIRVFLAIVPKKRGEDERGLLGLDLAFIMLTLLLFVSFFFPMHFTVIVFWFFILGMAEVLLMLRGKNQGDIALPKHTQQRHMFAVVLIGIIVLVGGVYATRLWSAELAFGSAITHAEKNDDFAAIESRLKTAARLASWDAVLQVTLGEQLAIRNYIEGEDANRAKESEQHIADARALDPLQPSVIAALFRTNNFLGAASPYSAAVLEEALALRLTQEPNQATHYLQYAQFLLEYLIADGTDVATSPQLAQAESLLAAAKERNPFLPGIDFTQAQVFSLLGRHEEALAILEALVEFYPDIQDFQDALEQERAAGIKTDTTE